ncbi:putative protein kinase RLK-Pelle-RLCK-VIIa-2 family [Helianthus annuus]|nr:putative protein kinase RLK-Pelle-RLCK-VIIa-2 family [Helianthus annuus]KAJ0929456.1 putative protein kinase RLK-Pelle-RLCK-VIIa-2 family [Helianthus annuus]
MAVPQLICKIEVNFLGQLAHPNINRLLGYCIDEPEHLLVYEYMPNKAFGYFLFEDIAKQLSWETRLSIMIGAARGLTYLHSKNFKLGGFKPSNILLDEDFNAKLGGFELEKYYRETLDSHGFPCVISRHSCYTAPEYIRIGQMTTKSDIYGFGKVLLESILGTEEGSCHRYGYEEHHSFLDWVTEIKLNKRMLEKILDLRFEGKYQLEGATECLALALRSVVDSPKDRPSSEKVLQSLEQIYARLSSEKLRQSLEQIFAVSP